MSKERIALLESWQFPIGGKCATLTIVGDPTDPIGPEDMDAIFEASMLFKRNIMRRHHLRNPPADYEI